MPIEQRHITTYEDLFVHRRDIYARQRENGSYFLRLSPVTPEVVRAHLAGKITAGFYALDSASTAAWGVLDADSPDGLEKLQLAWQRLHQLEIPSYLEQSRRGGHLWTFLESPIPGAGVRDLLRAGMGQLQNLELYPKQDALEPARKVGSLVRAPLGVHLLSGRRYPFLDPISLKPVSPTVAGTIDFLAEVEKVNLKRAAEVVARHKLQLEQKPAKLRVVNSAPRAKIQLGELTAFAEQYTKLNGAGRGSCPIPGHGPDTHPSFSITPDGRRWTCFHENVGGDVLDLFMRLEKLSSYKEALDKLSDISHG
jgi:hypothetical protein